MASCAFSMYKCTFSMYKPPPINLQPFTRLKLNIHGLQDWTSPLGASVWPLVWCELSQHRTHRQMWFKPSILPMKEAAWPQTCFASRGQIASVLSEIAPVLDVKLRWRDSGVRAWSGGRGENWTTRRGQSFVVAHTSCVRVVPLTQDCPFLSVVLWAAVLALPFLLFCL